MAQLSDTAEQKLLQASHRFSPGLCYVVTSTLLFVFWVGYYIFDPFGFDEPGRDTWHHVAVLRELMEEPFAPSNPHIPTQEPSRYFMPVNVVVAVIGRVFDLSPFTLFGYLGAASCIALVVGCQAFARRYYGSPWSPLILLLCLLFAWGLQRGHAGFHNYATFLSSAAYPSTIAFILGLFHWTLALVTIESDLNRKTHLLALLALTGVILLVHQLSGAIVIAISGSLTLFHSKVTAQVKAQSLAAMALGCLMVFAWPYFNVINVIFSVSDARWNSANTGIDTFPVTVILIIPALFGILGFRNSQREWRYEILFPAIVFSIAYFVLIFLGSAIAHRLVPAIILVMQLGLVWLVLEYFCKMDRLGYAQMALVAVICFFITASVFGAGKQRMYDIQVRTSTGPLLSTAKSLATYIPANSVSFATERIVYPLQSTGRRVVSIPRPEPAAPSLTERQVATDLFFSARASQRKRRQLIEHWNATHAVFSTADLRPDIVQMLRELGSSRKFPHKVEVIVFDQDARGFREQK